MSKPSLKETNGESVGELRKLHSQAIETRDNLSVAGSYKLQSYVVNIAADSASELISKIICLAKEFGFNQNQMEFGYEISSLETKSSAAKSSTPKKSRGSKANARKEGNAAGKTGSEDSGDAGDSEASATDTTATDTANKLQFDFEYKAEAKEERSDTEDEGQSGSKATTEEKKTYNKDELVQLLQRIVSEKSYTAAVDLLSSYNVDRLSALEEKDYPSFANACIATLEQ